ncbi:hypothetical protein [Aureibacter tunicatorum]|uniref:V8-like Glu-specific endopeptidase n=1 Tax=Aureibacter tunicatorum TaxID=866807 RepID=A0AAE3XKA4_9BACT|nr:hypothetical protein [Aureibacter tunicatorum]MDR6237331.1 V8-like Glu-specific endopeptidase [Aureibacter tunicatorum]
MTKNNKADMSTNISKKDSSYYHFNPEKNESSESNNKKHKGTPSNKNKSMNMSLNIIYYMIYKYTMEKAIRF